MVDLPTEEADMLVPHAAAHGIDVIRLVAPTTDTKRLPLVLENSSGFIYYVSITGITGTRSTTAEHLGEAIPRIRNASDLPIAVGFGVRSPSQAAEAVRIADAAVVGSALCSTIAANLGKPYLVQRLLEQVQLLADGVRGARVNA
jgi:tryptophan synthase alpha chain